MTAPGSSGARWERCAGGEARSGERAWVELDLDAVRANARTIRETAGVDLLAVVKADGYGHGAALVGRAALEAGAVGLAVATPREALALRHAGVGAPVQVLGSFLDDELEAAAAADVALTLHEPADLARVRAVALRRGRPVDVHVKVDVGMARHGVRPEEALDLLAAAHAEPAARLVGLMTHLPCAAGPDLAITRAQAAAFRGVIGRAERAGLRPSRAHAAASAALFRVPEARCDMVRPGIALLGLDPAGCIRPTGADLRPALALRARVMRLKRVPKGEAAGYGARWTAPRPSTLAIIGVGYGDGIPYTLTGAGGEVLVQGRRCPLVGTVMMDYLLADVTALPRPPAPGDVATLVGRQGAAAIPLEEQAAKAGLIPYALACGVGGRLARRVLGAEEARAPRQAA